LGSLLAFYFWFVCGWLLCVGFVQAPLVGACLVDLLGSVRFEPAVSFVVHLAGFVLGLVTMSTSFKIPNRGVGLCCLFVRLLVGLFILE
jgi:membrane associated rhomboid family serine protease